ncbi:Na/Pi cotransporter family protein [Robiginitalea sp. IMCC43444]|uniref:Na/Pi cotransporter family protein n=1 Tax=Robiginitalea sp. IMCC43444 TaxID=3459121 RepID=UPI0040412977
MEYGLSDILQLIGALGLFLFGMKVMSEALTDLAGDRMRAILQTMTSNRFMGIFTGFLITSVIQSSSATTLMVVSFSNASLLTLTEALGVIMGANIGTTITAWLITLLGFKVSMSALALPLVGFGFLFTFSKRKQWQYWGGFIIGFGLLFVGLQFLKDAMPDIHQNPEILAFLQRYTDLGFGSVLLFLLIGTLLTVIIQSSSATMALTLVMTAEGWIPFELAAAMVLGENIGTTITANIAAFVGNFRARQTAFAHFIFNVIGVVWMLLLFYPFLDGISWLSQELGSASPYLTAAAIPVAISLFHTSFNICNSLLLVWFINPIARLVSRVIPEKEAPEKAIEEPKFLNEKVLLFPQTAIASLEQESRYLFEHAVFEIVAHALNLHRTDILSDLKAKHVIRMSKENLQTDVRALYLLKVKRIYSQIISYAIHAQSDLDLSEKQHRRIMQIKFANRKMVEIIRDVSELNRNISLYKEEGHPVMQAEYDKFRKKMVKVLRAIQVYRAGANKEVTSEVLLKLSEEAKANIHQGNLHIDKLIRNNKVSPEMASSLLNDHDHLNEMIQKLIIVAELLYGEKDVMESITPSSSNYQTPVFEEDQLL